MEEIKATNIMIGNWFRINGFPMYVDAILRDTVYLQFEGNEGDVWEQDIKDLVPICLTEEILLKAGYIKNNKTEYSQGHVIAVNILTKQYIIVRNDVGDDWFYMNSYFKVGTVHHFQNITKVLTGNDLKIEV